jgi:hypothetical protein
MELIKSKSDYTVVAVWPATILNGDNPTTEKEVAEFEAFFMEQFGVRVQYLEEFKTLPSFSVDGEMISPGQRNEVVFAIHFEDVRKLVMPRLALKFHWMEDALVIYERIYPKEIHWRYGTQGQKS